MKFLNASETGRLSADIEGSTKEPMTHSAFKELGLNKAAKLYKTLNARSNFIQAWNEQWNELPTAKLPAIHK